MSDNFINDEAAQSILVKAEETMRNGLKRAAKKFGLSENQIDLEFDYGSSVTSRIEVDHENNRVKVITNVRPTDRVNCAQVMKNALESIQYMKVLKSNALELHDTVKRRNEMFSALYDAKADRKSLVKESEIRTMVVHTVILTHTKTKESVALTTTSDENISVWDLRREAHILLSKKVLKQ